MTFLLRLQVTKAAAFAVLASATTLPGSIATAADHLVLYGAQHPQMLDILVQGYKAKTGITVDVKAGDAPEIASQLEAEGSSSPADLFITENSPELLLLEEKGLLSPVDAATLAAVPAKFSSAGGHWVGILARENALQVNTALTKDISMPASLLELAKPEWKGKVAISPTDADFLPIISAVTALSGKDAATAWLQGLKDNAQVYQDDEAIVAAVEQGAAAVGVINSYYWYRLREETGASKMHSEIYHFPGGDVGGLINVSGGAILKSSTHQAEAQQFLAYAVSKEAQENLAKSNIVFEYPLASDVKANDALKPFADLQPPALSMEQLGDDQQAAQMLRDAGLL